MEVQAVLEKGEKKRATDRNKRADAKVAPKPRGRPKQGAGGGRARAVQKKEGSKGVMGLKLALEDDPTHQKQDDPEKQLAEAHGVSSSDTESDMAAEDSAIKDDWEKAMAQVDDREIAIETEDSHLPPDEVSASLGALFASEDEGACSEFPSDFGPTDAEGDSPAAESPSIWAPPASGTSSTDGSSSDTSSSSSCSSLGGATRPRQHCDRNHSHLAPPGCSLRRYAPPGKSPFWLGVLRLGFTDDDGHRTMSRVFDDIRFGRTEQDAKGSVLMWLNRFAG